MNEQKLRDDFERDGFVLIKNFYDVEALVKPVREGIQKIIRLVADDASLDVKCGSTDEALAEGFNKLIQHDRQLGAQVYDAVKQIPAFMRIVSCDQNVELFNILRPGAVPGLAAGGSGIRIDNPNEDKFRAYWHQDFPAQLRSIDGLVFWSPLVPIHSDLGPVQLAKGSHKAGLIPFYEDQGTSGRSGAYAMRLEDEAALIAKYETLAPLTNLGDLLVLDYLTLHQSGKNIADMSRWSMQFRYFNFADPIGRHFKWTGAFSDGKDINAVFHEVEKVRKN